MAEAMSEGASFHCGRSRHILSLAVSLLHQLEFWHMDQGTRVLMQRFSTCGSRPLWESNDPLTGVP